jgi:Fic family protein
MHAELMRGARGAKRTPGEFRRTQNWIGGTNPSNARFVPPPVDALEGALDDFEAFLHEDIRVPVLIRCALAHFQFETIHPFLDGNGRLGRLLIVFYLTDRDEYVAALQGARETGDLDRWFRFFLRGVTRQANRAIESADALLRLREDFRERLRRARARGQAIDAAEGLIANPFLTAPRVAQTLGVTRQGAQYVIGSLQRAGIVDVAAGDQRPMLYVARDVLEVLQRD